VARLSDVVSANPDIHEIELNPVLVTDEQAIAVDAIIRREEDHA